MTLGDGVLGREVERIHARINSAPVEEWLRREFRAELDRIAKIADDRITVARTFAETEKVEESTVAELPAEWETRQNRREAAHLATFNGVFHKDSAESILRFLDES